MTDFEVRRIRTGEGARYREVRLRALADTPSAFGSTYAAEAEASLDHWNHLAEERSAGDWNAAFVAIDAAGESIGLIGGYREPDVPEVTELVSMWVAPQQRGGGVADRLVAAVVAFASGNGSERVELWVTVGNDRAFAFYVRNGFEPLGEFAPLPSDPCKNEQRMRMVL